MSVYNNQNSEKSLIISMRDSSKQNFFVPEKHKTNKTFKYNAIVKIDLRSKSKEVISSGHRNPSGLIVTKDNFIISTEHGSRDGDEINKIIKGKNYGWPISSYGEPYGNNIGEPFFYLKDHETEGFSFIPSIGISQLIEVPDNFSKFWKDNYLITSLRDQSLFSIKFDEDYNKIIYMEKILIGKRIRDISYDHNNKAFLLALENSEGNLAFIRAID